MARRNQAPTESEVFTSAATETITIQGLEFTAPLRYQAGHVLTENEAGALNQTYHENLRNNFASKVKAAKEAAEKGEDEEGYAPLDLEDLQRQFDEYAAEYQFGARRPGAGPKDPVEQRAMVMARQIIRNALKQAGRNVKDYSDQIDTLAKNFLDTTEAGANVREQARENLERERAQAEAAASSLNLPGLD